MKTQLLVLAAVMFLSACATPHKVYQAPSNAKVTASTLAVRTGITKSRDTAREAEQLVQDAQSHADAVLTRSTAVLGKVDGLALIAPAVMQGPIGVLRTDVVDLQGEETLLASSLSQARAKQDTLNAQLTETVLRESELEQHQAGYYSDAQQLAKTATAEREQRITVEKKLSWYRYHFFLSWGIAAAGVLVCIVLAFLKFTGRLAVSAAKIAG